MTVGSRLVPEPAPAKPGPELTHAARFLHVSGIDSADWRTGRDLLMVSDTATRRTSQLPARPRTRPGATMQQLWIPRDPEDSGVVGPVYGVSSTRSGPLLRALASVPVRFLPDLHVCVGEERLRVLGALDSLDASALARVRKLIRQDTILSPDDLFPASGNSAAFGLPPAARSILDSILRSRPGEAHIAPLKKRGAMPLVRLLLDRQLILMLSGGQLIATVSLAELASQLPNGTELAVPDIAGLWQTSVGTARGLVSALMDEGFLDRTAPGIYKVVTPGSRTDG